MEQSFKAKRRTLKVDIEEDTYRMRFPLVAQVESYEKKLKQAGPEKAFEIMEQWFEELGLPKDAFAKLEMDDVLTIGRILGGQKKS